MLKKRIISFMTALSMTLMIFTSMPISVLALPITDNCTGNHSVMTAWNATEHLPTTGMYYLNTDVTISSQTTINSGDDLTLCLNGHTVNAEGNSRIFLY